MLDFATTNVRTWIAPIGGLIQRCNLRALRRQRVSEVSLTLLHLVQDLQLHRGLSGAVLTGRGGFGSDLDAVEHKLQRSLHALTDYFGDRHPVFRDAQWRIVLGRWESLRNNWRGLAFNTNLSLHGEVIGGILGILRLLASENAHLLGAARAQVIRSWPALVEQLGVLRALGLHVLAQAEAAPGADDREAMAARIQSVRCVLHAISPDIGDPAVIAATRQALETAARVAQRSEPALPAEAFHAEMSAVIDAWFRLIRSRTQVQL